MSVLIYLENWNGKFKKISFELVCYASKLAEMLGEKAIVLSFGDPEKSELEKLAVFGADKVLLIDNNSFKDFDEQAYTSLIADVVRKNEANIIVLANNNAGKALAPRLSVRLKAGVASCVSKLPVSISPFVVYKKVYSGKAFANVLIKTETKILTLAQNSFDLVETPKPLICENIDIKPDASLLKTQVKEVNRQSGKILINDADIVVSGGRGMKSPDNWGPLEELAGLLGAATACSRPVSDEGWRSHEEHTGQTGKIIAPNLYFAIGISGATQHLAGISSSKFIVAINSDKDAPIFEAAQYGIIGDALKVLPKLVEAVKEMKSK